MIWTVSLLTGLISLFDRGDTGLANWFLVSQDKAAVALISCLKFGLSGWVGSGVNCNSSSMIPSSLFTSSKSWNTLLSLSSGS